MEVIALVVAALAALGALAAAWYAKSQRDLARRSADAADKAADAADRSAKAAAEQAAVSRQTLRETRRKWIRVEHARFAVAGDDLEVDHMVIHNVGNDTIERLELRLDLGDVQFHPVPAPTDDDDLSDIFGGRHETYDQPLEVGEFHWFELAGGGRAQVTITVVTSADAWAELHNIEVPG